MKLVSWLQMFSAQRKITPSFDSSPNVQYIIDNEILAVGHISDILIWRLFSDLKSSQYLVFFDKNAKICEKFFFFVSSHRLYKFRAFILFWGFIDPQVEHQFIPGEGHYNNLKHPFLPTKVTKTITKRGEALKIEI